MKNIGSQTELNSTLAAAGSRLVVLDFFATWCGPCKTLSPVLEGLEREHSSTIFAKVDVDQAQDCAKAYQVTSMPTIVFFKSKSEVGRVVGANVGEIKSLIKRYEGGDAFSGTGQTLGGGSNSGDINSATGGWTLPLGLHNWIPVALGGKEPEPPKTVEGPGGSCQIQVRLMDGSTIRGDFEPSHTLQQVHDFVRANLEARNARVQEFLLMTNFPKVMYEGEGLQQTLEEAKLTPRAQLIVRA
ncbi:hypothetical protein BGZ98_001303 [Dissophora globulifera]|nr:hypothetical protein BGZ98_001303 [Dissophora globulifera]